MKNAEALLFDLDGTLSDSKEGITKSLAYAVEQMGCTPPLPEQLATSIGAPLRQKLGELLNTTEAEAIERAVGLYRHRYNVLGLGIVENSLYPRVADVLKALKGVGKRLFIATSKAKEISDNVLTHFSIEELFDGVYGSEPDGTRSDKAELIAYVLASEGLVPEKTVMIGDRELDILGAKKNGLQSVGACWGYGSVEELERAGATALAESPMQLLKVFGG